MRRSARKTIRETTLWVVTVRVEKLAKITLILRTNVSSLLQVEGLSNDYLKKWIKYKYNSHVKPYVDTYLLIPLILFLKCFSHAYIFTARMPRMISLRSFSLRSASSAAFFRRFEIISEAFSWTISIRVNKAKPGKTCQPIREYEIEQAANTANGAMQTLGKYLTASLNRWTSFEIRLITWPDVMIARSPCDKCSTCTHTQKKKTGNPKS